MKAKQIIIEFWTYEITGVQLPTDIWLHCIRETGERFASRVAPSSAHRDEAIKEAEILAELLGLKLEIRDTVLKLPPEQKAMIESGELACV
jgi:hypothetical protein